MGGESGDQLAPLVFSKASHVNDNKAEESPRWPFMHGSQFNIEVDEASTSVFGRFTVIVVYQARPFPIALVLRVPSACTMRST